MIEDVLYKIKETSKLVLNSKSLKLRDNLGYLPRWLVYFFDIQIVVFVLITSSFIVNDFSFVFFNTTLLPKIFITVGVAAVYFLLFKIYVGLIRYSSYIDTIKVLFSSLCTTVTLLIINTIAENFYSTTFFKPIFLVVFSLGLFFSLLAYRILIKQVYSKFVFENNKDLSGVFILGTSQNSISTALAIENEFPKRFKVIGFIGHVAKQNNKRVLGMPILPVNRKISVLMRAYRATSLIVNDDDLKNDDNIKVIEDCIDANFKVFRAPVITELDFNKGFNDNIQNIQIEDLLERKPIQINNNEILSLIKNKVVLVSGGAGSIGSEIVNQLAKYNPKELIVIDQAETPLHNLSLKLKEKYPTLNFTPIICDIRNKKALNLLFERKAPQVIYHSAAYKHVPLMEKNPGEAVSVNIEGTKNIADLAAAHNAEKFIMISTDKAVNPSNVMGATKRVAEMYVQSLHNYLHQLNSNSTKFITTRFGNVLGSNGSVVPLFKKQIAAGGPLTITHPDIIRYFMTIPEASQLVIEASSMGNGGEIFIFDMGKAVKILDLAKKMIKLAGFIPGKEIKIETIGLRPGEKLYEELLSEASITLPTYHEKIMIVKENNDDYETVCGHVKELIEISYSFKAKELVKKIKLIVPEFKSLNSTFEELD